MGGGYAAPQLLPQFLRPVCSRVQAKDAPFDFSTGGGGMVCSNFAPVFASGVLARPGKGRAVRLFNGGMVCPNSTPVFTSGARAQADTPKNATSWGNWEY